MFSIMLGNLNQVRIPHIILPPNKVGIYNMVSNILFAYLLRTFDFVNTR